MSIEYNESNYHDSRPSNNLGSITLSLAIVALTVSLVAVWLIQEDKRQMQTGTELAKVKTALSNTVLVAQQLFNERNRVADLANKKQKFIDDTFAHFGRFFTNSKVSELEWSQGRVGTVVDTNDFWQEWSFTVTPTNVVVRKRVLESKLKTPAP